MTMKQLGAAIVLILFLSSCKTTDPGMTRTEQEAMYPDYFKYSEVINPTLSKGIFKFRVSLDMANHNYLTVKDPIGGAPVPVVERFEVRPGDCFKSDSGGWDDCKNDRERAEFIEQGWRQKEGDTWWYGWSIFVPRGYPNVYPVKVALGQFHEGKKPSFMFQNHTGGYWLDFQLVDRYYKLIDKEDFRGKWHRIEIMAHWSRKKDGIFRVWVNGEQKVDINHKTMSSPTNYFKYGIYRSYISRYRAKNVPTQIVYYANIKKSRTREGLLPDPI